MTLPPSTKLVIIVLVHYVYPVEFVNAPRTLPPSGKVIFHCVTEKSVFLTLNNFYFINLELKNVTTLRTVENGIL
jgi:hypothetical protein